MEISLVRTNKCDVLKKISNSKKFDKYIFLGKNPVLGNDIESFLNNKIDKIPFSKKFIDIQYKFRDNYINFIDHIEKNEFNDIWWDTRLSGKNPWISFAYFRLCQLLLIKEILKKNIKENIKLLIIFEEECVFNSAFELIKREFNCKIDKIVFNDYSKFKLIIRGVIRRILAFPFYLYKILILKIIFRSFKTKDFLLNKVFVFSFLDSRCFKKNDFIDPFLGKFLKKINLNQSISYIPVLYDIPIKKLLVFRKWIVNNKYSVTFLPFHFTFGGLFFEFFKFNFIFKKNVNYFEKINLSAIIQRERLEEWSDFNFQNFLVRSISEKIKKSRNNKLIVYPFENQIWERNMLSIFNNDKCTKVFGVQNAPSPKLSLRYFISNQVIDSLPLPNYIFVTGKISYENLVEFYGKNILRLSSTSRKIINDNDNVIRKNHIMVACSISIIESQELIMFVCKSLKGCAKFEVKIIPHPLAKFNFKKFLKQIKAPSYFSISDNYDYNLKHCKFIVFDSSTAGIEGLLNGMIPIRIANNYMLNVNPSEYDTQFTKYAYNSKDFMSIISECDSFDKGYKNVGLNYYKTEESKEFNEAISEIEFLSYEK